MARKTKHASKKEYTLDEFKAWLEGIEELQPANWAPDANQWKTIRTKIFNIVEEVAEVSAPIHPIPVAHQPVPVPARLPPAHAPAMPSALPPVEPAPEMTPAAKAALGGALPPEMVPSADGKVKTPNIDTSDGDYGSSFE